MLLLQDFETGLRGDSEVPLIEKLPLGWRAVAWEVSYTLRILEGEIYPRVSIRAYCLRHDNSLGKFDATYPYTWVRRVPYP